MNSYDDRYFGFDGASLALDAEVSPPTVGSHRSGAVLELKTAQNGSSPPSIRATALVFEDPRSRALEERIRRFAKSDASVLIIGQTGTGKELVARHVHAHSDRAKGPFVAINCAALPESLADAELFGHEKGAFTGATEARQGYFEAAQGGTLFLDEIGDLSLPMQIKLLRVLQERTIFRLGARKPRMLDVRIIAATNVDLERAVASGRFREDLYFRINVARLDVLPLAKRPLDIPPLVEHFLQLYAQRSNLPIPELTNEAKQRLQTYSWPGNIRELENAIHHAMLLAQHNIIQQDDLMLAEGATPRDEPSHEDNLESLLNGMMDQAKATESHSLDEQSEKTGIFEHVIQQMISLAMKRTRGNQVQAAKLLGISRNTLRTHLTRFGYLPSPTK
ncbi:Sigma54-dependent transcriptional activator SfnR [Halomonadaceae bacterium LMG 33818]|uniref:sigma-54 interaction domain-containing protein n=1 Tax=Cernens ardua TaxID=3402176 RepID=UPI003EDC2E99